MQDRIEIDPRVCNGSPVIRGTRIPVAVILDHLATAESWESILRGFPELQRDDIAAALAFARQLVDRADAILRNKQLPGPPPGWFPGCTETAAGMLADEWTEEDDRLFEEIHQDRERTGWREIPD